MRKPLVGIVGETYDLKTPFTKEVEIAAPENTDFQTENVLYNAENFITFFNGVDCHACIISAQADLTIIEHFDIIVIPGGPDIPPGYYGQEAHPKTFVDKRGTRDKFEKNLIELAIKKKKPILAICRGFQMVNAVLGGTLHQHIPDLPEMLVHRSTISPTAYAHKVQTFGWLKNEVGKEIEVNSWHHQGIDKLASTLSPLAKSSDGLVEAYETKKGHSPILGIQWHPEILQDEKSMKILSYFIKNFSGQ